MTTSTTAVSTRHPAEISGVRLWVPLVVPPAVWIAQGSLGWFFGDRICDSMSIAAVRWVVGVISLTALAAAAAGVAVAWGSWRQTTSEPDPRHVQAWDRVEFMSAAGVLVSAVFGLGILWAGLSSVLIGVCGVVR